MVARQLAARGIRDARVLAAMAWLPREWFLPPHLAAAAYDDGPLPIGSGQTISQPYVVALMTAALAPRRGGAGNRHRLGLPGGDPRAPRRPGVHRGAPPRPPGRGRGTVPPPRTRRHRDPPRRRRRRLARARAVPGHPRHRCGAERARSAHRATRPRRPPRDPDRRPRRPGPGDPRAPRPRVRGTARGRRALRPPDLAARLPRGAAGVRRAPDDLLGAHVSTQGGVARAPARGAAIGATAIQVFTAPPNQWREP